MTTLFAQQPDGRIVITPNAALTPEQEVQLGGQDGERDILPEGDGQYRFITITGERSAELRKQALRWHIDEIVRHSEGDKELIRTLLESGWEKIPE